MVKLVSAIFDEWNDGQPGLAAIFHEIPHAWLLIEGDRNDPTTWTLSPSIHCVVGMVI